MFSKAPLAAALVVGAVTLAASLAIAAPAFASPTPDPDPAVTIANVTGTISNTAGRQVQVLFNYELSDDTQVGDTIVEVTTFDSCGSPTVTDVDDQLPITPVPNTFGGVSQYVAIPATGYVEIQLFTSNGGGAPLVSTPVYTTDTAVVPSNFGASIVPDASPTTGTASGNAGNAASPVQVQLEVNGVPSGAVLNVPGCSTFNTTYSAAAGDVVTLHSVDGNFDMATFTVPAAVVAPPAAVTPSDPKLAATGASAGGPLLLGGILLLSGLVVLLVFRIRRRA